MHKAVEYWASGRGAKHITPRGKDWPEGEEFAAFLSEMIPDGVVLDFGCGPGRLAPCFGWTRYLGMDVCAEAIEQARQRHPEYSFRVLEPDERMLWSETILAHTVLLHVPDDLLPEIVAGFRGSRTVIVSEIMGRKWRRSGNPPVFNREPSEYVEIFRSADFELVETWEHPYPHYPDEVLTMLKFQRVPA